MEFKQNRMVQTEKKKKAFFVKKWLIIFDALLEDVSVPETIV